MLNFLNYWKFHRTPYQMYFQGVYRARAVSCDSIEKACEVLGHIDGLSSAPDKFAKACRCNKDGKSVFYCSNENGVPIFEIRPEIGQYIVVAGFKPKRHSTFDLQLPIIGVKQIRESLYNRNPFDIMVNILSEDMHYQKDFFDKVSLLIDSNLARWFSERIDDSNKYIYRLTSTFYQILTNNVRYDEDKIHALIYPSVESNVTGYNIAIEKEIVNDGLKVGRATIYYLLDKKQNEYVLQPLKEIDRIIGGSTIVWRNSTSKEFFRLTPETDTLSFNGEQIFNL